MSSGTIASFIDEHTAVIAPLTRDLGLAYWMSRTTGKKEYLEQTAELEARWQRCYSSADERAAISRWLSGNGDADQKRVLSVLHRLYTANQKTPEEIAALVALECRVSELFTNFRGHVRGRPVSNNEIERILGESDDSEERREAWEASKQIGPLASELVLQMVELRNAYARRMGARDHFGLSLTLAEIDESFLWRTFELLEVESDAPFAQAKSLLDAELAKRFCVRTADLRPWHYADPFFQRAPRTAAVDLDSRLHGQDLVVLALRTYDRIGLEIRDLVKASDLWGREGKDQGGFCMNVDREGDIRVLVNLASNQRWTNTLLHEYGHAVYDQHIDRSLPFVIRQPAHTITTEAMALLMGRLSQDPLWLREVLGLSSADIAALEPHLRSYQRLSMLIFLRWGLVMTNFERELYRDPSQDLNSLWWQLVERFQRVPRPEGRDAPDWAAKLHLAEAPVYYQNYVLGELIASQLKTWLRRETGGHFLESRRSGELLVSRFFAPGARMAWMDLVRHATGEALDARFFMEEFVRGS